MVGRAPLAAIRARNVSGAKERRLPLRTPHGVHAAAGISGWRTASTGEHRFVAQLARWCADGPIVALRMTAPHDMAGGARRVGAEC